MEGCQNKTAAKYLGNGSRTPKDFPTFSYKPTHTHQIFAFVQAIREISFQIKQKTSLFDLILYNNIDISLLFIECLFKFYLFFVLSLFIYCVRVPIMCVCICVFRHMYIFIPTCLVSSHSIKGHITELDIQWIPPTIHLFRHSPARQTDNPHHLPILNIGLAMLFCYVNQMQLFYFVFFFFHLFLSVLFSILCADIFFYVYILCTHILLLLYQLEQWRIFINIRNSIFNWRMFVKKS